VFEIFAQLKDWEGIPRLLNDQF